MAPNERRVTRSLLSVSLLAAIVLAAPAPAFPAPAAGSTGTAPRHPVPSAPRLEGFYDIATASAAELKRVNAENTAIRRIRIGDTLDYLYRRHGKPRTVTEKSKGTPDYYRILGYDDFDVRVDADGRISRIRVRASGAWMMHNGLRGLMQDFDETRMRRLFGWNYRRQLQRVYVWRISRSRFAQDEDRERLLRMVRQYYKLPTRDAAEKKIIRAWDTVYVYPERGLRMRIYSNIPIAGRFKADFVLMKPLPPERAASPGSGADPPSGKITPPAGSATRPAATTAPPDWTRDRALEAELALRDVRGVTILRKGRSLRLRGTVGDDPTLRRVYEFIREKGFGEVDYGVEVRGRPPRTPK